MYPSLPQYMVTFRLTNFFQIPAFLFLPLVY